MTSRMMPPLVTPALPSPAIARPMMNAIEFGAAPQMVDPISKIPMTVKKTYFGG